MIGVILAILAVADLVLIVAFLQLQRKQVANQQLVRELTEERALLSDLRSQIRSELLSAQQQARALKDQVQVLATEAEQEVRRGIGEISHEVENIVANITTKLEQPLQILNDKQHYIARLSKDAENQRELLARVVSRAENAASLLKAGGSWKDVVDQIERRRLEDIRAMIAKGVQTERIARDLGVSENEVRLISGTL
jgi:DNA anti-recombination protein RmuC